MKNEDIESYTISGVILGLILFLPAGIALGYWFDSGSDRVETIYETVEVPRSRRDESTKACVDNGGVPTYSAWDGTLNGCITVGQSNRDSNVQIEIGQ